MDYSTMIHKDLIFLNENAADRKTLFRMLPRRFARLGMLRTLMKLPLTNAKMSSRLGLFFLRSRSCYRMPILRT